MSFVYLAMLYQVRSRAGGCGQGQGRRRGEGQGWGADICVPSHALPGEVKGGGGAGAGEEEGSRGRGGGLSFVHLAMFYQGRLNRGGGEMGVRGGGCKGGDEG